MNRGEIIPTIDCSLQPSPVKKGKRKTAIAVALASIALLIRAFLHAGGIDSQKNDDSSEETSSVVRSENRARN